MWGLGGAVYAALIVSSLDLHEAPVSVSVTGLAEGCASLVFDLYLCAEGRGGNFYRTTVPFMFGIKSRSTTDCVALGNLPTRSEPCLAHLQNGSLVMQPWDVWEGSSETRDTALG